MLYQTTRNTALMKLSCWKWNHHVALARSSLFDALMVVMPWVHFAFMLFHPYTREFYAQGRNKFALFSEELTRVQLFFCILHRFGQSM